MGQVLCIGHRYCPVRFLQRFRIAVRKTLYFQQRMTKKGPRYFNCNEAQTTCTDSKADPFRGCPDCEFTIQYNIYRSELEKELSNIKGARLQDSLKWPVPTLLKIVSEMGHLSYMYKDSSDKKWHIQTTTLVGIYRDEVAKIKAIESYNAGPAPAVSSEDDNYDE